MWFLRYTLKNHTLLHHFNDIVNKYSTLYEKGCISGLKYHGFPNKLLQYVLFVVFEVHLPANTFEVYPEERAIKCYQKDKCIIKK